MKRTKDKMIQKAVHIIFALALLLAFAPPAHAAKHSAELFLQVGHAAGVNSVSFSQNIAINLIVSKND